MNYLMALFLLMGGKKKKNKMTEKEQVEEHLSQLEEEFEGINMDLAGVMIDQEFLATPGAYHPADPRRIAETIVRLNARKQYLKREIELAKGRLDTMRRDPEKFKY